MRAARAGKILLQPPWNGAVSTVAMHRHARNALAVLLAAATVAFMAGANGVRAGARGSAQREAQDGDASDAEAAFERFKMVATEYVDSVDTIMIEAEDAVSTCEKSPKNDTTPGGRPRFLEAQRARTAFDRHIQAFEKSVRAVANAARPAAQAKRADSAQAMVRATAADLKAVEAIAGYLDSRGNDKHEEFAKARAKLTSLKSGAIAQVRATALRDLGIKWP